MDIFVARQPILSSVEEIVGYELLYRNSKNNAFTHTDGDIATVELLLNSFLGIGNQQVSKGKKVFVNFTKNLLVKRIPCLFPPENIVIEILENVDGGDEEVLRALKELKERGYTIALDDFFLKDINIPLLPYADIIKVDFLQTSYVQRKIFNRIAKKHNAKLLAEKVETKAVYQDALLEGYDFFQGYYFSKPTILTSTDIPFYSNNYGEILRELHIPEPDIDKIAKIIEYDLSLSYKILKIVNTMAYYTRVKITSIKQAIVILGLNELLKLITIISLKEKQDTTSIGNELILNSLIRAKLTEQFGEKLFGGPHKSECFMLGLLSLLDSILKRPMHEIVQTLPLSDKISNALLGEDSEYKILLNIVSALENANWDLLDEYSSQIAPLSFLKCYEEAVRWSERINSSISSEINSAVEKI